MWLEEAAGNKAPAQLQNAVRARGTSRKIMPLAMEDMVRLDMGTVTLEEGGVARDVKMTGAAVGVEDRRCSGHFQKREHQRSRNAKRQRTAIEPCGQCQSLACLPAVERRSAAELLDPVDCLLLAESASPYPRPLHPK